MISTYRWPSYTQSTFLLQIHLWVFGGYWKEMYLFSRTLRLWLFWGEDLLPTTQMCVSILECFLVIGKQVTNNMVNHMSDPGWGFLSFSFSPHILIFMFDNISSPQPPFFSPSPRALWRQRRSPSRCRRPRPLGGRPRAAHWSIGNKCNWFW